MSILLPQLIERIAALQSAGDRYYPAGLFPSQRVKRALGYYREDSNVFFTAIIAFTLGEIRSQLPAASQALADTILARAVNTYSLYQNKDGLPTYNFYQTRPSRHMPNGYLMRHTRHFQLPDDADDTVLVYLTTPRTPAEDTWLKAKLRAHANTVKGLTFAGPPQFRHRKIYSAWFGEKIPIDLDASTLSNLLLWVFRKKLPLDEFDQDALAFIAHVVESGLYRRRPLSVSAYYATAPIIGYHVSRLLMVAPGLAGCREALGRDARELLPQTTDLVEKILLGITLLRLGDPPPALLDPAWTLADVVARTRKFRFFMAPFLNYYPQTKWLATWPLSHLRWECPAHSLALVAEYLALGGR